MNSNYVNFRTSGTFSICQSYGTPEQYVDRAVALGSNAVCLSDIGNMSGHPRLEVACRSAGIRPIYGVQLGIETPGERTVDQVVLVARNAEGYAAMAKNASLANDPDHFYYTARLSAAEVAKVGPDVLVVYCPLPSANPKDTAAQVREIATGATVYVADDHNGTPQQRRAARVAARQAGTLTVDCPQVVMPERHQEALVRFMRSVKPKSMAPPVDPRAHLSGYAGAVARSGGVDHHSAQLVATLVEDAITDYDLPRAPDLSSGEDDPGARLRELCVEGLARVERQDDSEYQQRMDYELGLIDTKGFADYFLIVEGIVRWARQQGIAVGPGRGSVGGSLVAYLAGITAVDPLHWGLMFERFIDVSRDDPPDIDIDFQDDRRHEVYEHLQETYGVQRVSQVAGYSLFKGRSLLDDIGRVFSLPKHEVALAKADLVDNGGTSTVREALEHRWPHLAPLADVAGQVRHLTIHAAGAVVSSEPLERLTVIGRNGLMLDKRDIERLGLLKIDMLGLRTLTVLSRITNLVFGEPVDWLYSHVPLDDPETLEAFASTDFMGVFQYEGATTKRVCRQVAPRSFEELVDINALSRPGPLSSGSTDAYIHHRSEDVHPVVTRHTSRSRGQVLFQEQVMSVLREAGRLDWADVTMVRRLVTKHEGEELLEGVHQRFLQAFDDRELGEQVWSLLGESGSYGFNRAHSTAYTMLGYYCMWLKKHYPPVFYWSNMVSEPGNTELLMEHFYNGGQVAQVRYGLSEANWTLDNDVLRAGYSTLPGVGPKTAERLQNRDKPPTPSVDKKLRAVDAYNDTDLVGDFLEVGAIADRLRDMVGRTTIGDMLQQRGQVSVGGQVGELDVRDLRIVLANRGEDHEKELSDPHLTLYAYLPIHDETGATTLAFNRYVYPKVAEVLKSLRPGDVVECSGGFDKAAERLRCKRIRKVSQ